MVSPGPTPSAASGSGRPVRRRGALRCRRPCLPNRLRERSRCEPVVASATRVQISPVAERTLGRVEHRRRALARDVPYDLGARANGSTTSSDELARAGAIRHVERFNLEAALGSRGSGSPSTRASARIREFVGQRRTHVLLALLVACAEGSVVPACVVQAHRSIRTTPNPVGVMVVLAVVFPEADGTDLVSAPLVEREAPATRARVSNARLRAPHHGVRTEFSDVVLEPALSPTQVFGRWFLVVGHRAAEGQRGRWHAGVVALRRSQEAGTPRVYGAGARPMDRGGPGARRSLRGTDGGRLGAWGSPWRTDRGGPGASLSPRGTDRGGFGAWRSLRGTGRGVPRARRSLRATDRGWSCNGGRGWPTRTAKERNAP